MEDDELFRFDPLFDFSSVFKRNYCTLFNISTCEVKLKYAYTVDGKLAKLSFPEGTLFSLRCREWMHKNDFQIEPTAFFSTRELALDYIKDNLDKFGLVKIGREEAIELAKEKLSLSS